MQITMNVFRKMTSPTPVQSRGILHVREEMDFYRFKRLLKTHTFSLAYNVY